MSTISTDFYFLCNELSAKSKSYLVPFLCRFLRDVSYLARQFAKFQFLFLLFCQGIIPKTFSINSPGVCSPELRNLLNFCECYNFAMYLNSFEQYKNNQYRLLLWSLNTWMTGLDSTVGNLLLQHVNKLSDHTYNFSAMHYQSRLLWLITKKKTNSETRAFTPFTFNKLKCHPFFDISAPPPELIITNKHSQAPTVVPPVSVIGLEEELNPTQAFNDNLWFINLSHKQISDDMTNLLKLGFKYAVQNTKFDTSRFIAPIEGCLGELNNQVEANQIRSTLTNLIKKFHNKRSNNAFVKAKNCIQNIRRDKTVILVNADKGNSTILMDRQEYNEKMLSYLSNHLLFKKVSRDPSTKIIQETKELLSDFKSKHFITTDFYKASLPSTNLGAPTIFAQLKMHKPDRPLRPILNSRQNPTRNLAASLSCILSRFRPFCNFSLRNTDDFLNRVKEIRLQRNDKLVSMDVVNMFNSLRHDYVLKAIDYFVENYNISLPFQVDVLKELVMQVIRSSYCKFDKDFYIQVQGLAMGSPLSPILSDITLTFFEMTVVQQYTLQPISWLRYVDDAFFIWRHTLRQLNMFFKFINQAVDGINFTMEVGQNECLNYLDLTIKKDGDGLRTSIFRKKTFSARYLSFTSTHPFSVKKGIALNMFRRAIAYTSDSAELEHEFQNITDILVLNGYPHSVIKKALFCANQDKQTSNPKPDYKRSISLDYVPGLSEQLASHLRKMGHQVIYKPRSTLAELYYQRYNPVNVLEVEGCVYSISCQCGKIYIGETKRKLEKRIKEHKRFTDEKFKGDPSLKFHSAVAFHSTTEQHVIEWDKVKILAVEKHDYTRKVKEAYYIKLHKPGLNLNEGVYIPPQWYFVLKQSLK